MGVVQAGEGCDDAKVLTPAMDAATKQCSDKARHKDPGCEGSKGINRKTRGRQRQKEEKNLKTKRAKALPPVVPRCSENPDDVLACPDDFDIFFRRSC